MFKLKSLSGRFKKMLVSAMVAASVSVMLAVPSFAAEATTPFVDAAGVIDPTVFDPLTSGITANIGAVMPKIVIVVGILIAIGVVFAFVRKHTKV